jgi:hypothetical protein
MYELRSVARLTQWSLIHDWNCWYGCLTIITVTVATAWYLFCSIVGVRDYEQELRVSTAMAKANAYTAVACHGYLLALSVRYALRYSSTARVSRALCSADVITSVTDTTSAIMTASRSVDVRYIWNLSGSGRNPTSW